MSINLLPWRETLYQCRKRRLSIESMICLVLSLLFVSWGYFKSQVILSDQNKEIVRLESEIKKTSKDYFLVISSQKKINEERIKEAFLKGALDFNLESLQIIEKISDNMPTSVYLTQINRKENKLHFIGKSYSHAELAEFLDNVKSQVKKQPIMTETAHAEGEEGEIGFDVEYGV